MRTNLTRAKRSLGFTLIEMIGVLAVIAILAALLVPKIFEAINNARVNNAAVSYNTAKTAIADHYAKYGTLLSSNGVPIAAGVGESLNFDKVLVSEGFMDKPFIVKIGDGITNHVEILPSAGTNAVTTANAAYDLDGSGTLPNDAAGSVLVQAVITGVAAGDAKDLNDRIDGPSLGEDATGNDLKGRVKYAAPGAGGTTTVYLYISHR